MNESSKQVWPAINTPLAIALHVFQCPLAHISEELVNIG